MIPSQTPEEELYYACRTFCDEFFHMMCIKFKFERAGQYYEPTYERNKIIDYEEERFRHAYKRLTEAINKVEEGD